MPNVHFVLRSIIVCHTVLSNLICRGWLLKKKKFFIIYKRESLCWSLRHYKSIENILFYKMYCFSYDLHGSTLINTAAKAPQNKNYIHLRFFIKLFRIYVKQFQLNSSIRLEYKFVKNCFLGRFYFNKCVFELKG